MGGGANDSHGFADESGGIAHGANAAAAPVVVGATSRNVAVDGLFHVIGGNAGTDANQHLSLESVSHASLAQNTLDHVWLAGQQDNLGLLDGADVVVADDFDSGHVGSHVLFDSLGALLAADAGNELGGEGRGDVVACLLDARVDGAEDTVGDGDAHGAYEGV